MSMLVDFVLQVLANTIGGVFAAVVLASFGYLFARFTSFLFKMKNILNLVDKLAQLDALQQSAILKNIGTNSATTSSAVKNVKARTYGKKNGT